MGLSKFVPYLFFRNHSSSTLGDISNRTPRLNFANAICLQNTFLKKIIHKFTIKI